MGNSTVTATSPSQTGWFGSLTNNLANLATSTAPIIGSFTSNGTKAPAANAATPGSAANPGTSITNSPNFLLYAGGAVVALILVVVLVIKKK